MPPLGTTPVNPAAGGANITTDTQSTGAVLPVSEILVAPAVGSDSEQVTPTNPFPVYLVAGGAGGTAPTGTGQAVTPLTKSDLDEVTRLLKAILRGVAILADVDEKDLTDG